MFLCWYLDLEPAHITGFDATAANPGELRAVFNDAHDFLLPNRAETQDAEALYVVGVMLNIAGWLPGDVEAWTSRSEQHRLRYRALSPAGVDPDVFRNRGAYGDYFGGQARVKGGF